MKKCSLNRPHDINAAWKIVMRDCIMKRVQQEKSVREKTCNMKRAWHGGVKCEKCTVKGKAAAKEGTMKRSEVKVQTEKNCNIKLVLPKKVCKRRKVQHEKSPTRKKVQHEKIPTWKKVQHEKSVTRKMLQHEKHATRKKVQHEKNAQ